MTTITWLIESMQCKPVDGSYTNVVLTADWRCVATETTGTGDNTKNYLASSYGASSFSIPDGSFTPYENLTQEQVLGWCWTGGVSKDEVELSVQQKMQNLITPPVETPPLPWIQGN
jgi:phosphoribulokinase